MSRRIIVTSSPSGDVRVEAKGFSGTSCQQATAPLEAAIGDVVTKAPTAEAFQVEAQTNVEAQQG